MPFYCVYYSAQYTNLTSDTTNTNTNTKALVLGKSLHCWVSHKSGSQQGASKHAEGKSMLDTADNDDHPPLYWCWSWTKSQNWSVCDAAKYVATTNAVNLKCCFDLNSQRVSRSLSAAQEIYFRHQHIAWIDLRSLTLRPFQMPQTFWPNKPAKYLLAK